MKYFWVLFFFAPSLWATSSRMVDGQVQFPVATVDGKTAWSTAERDAMIVGTSVVVGVTAAPDEITLSTAVPVGQIKWKNLTEYLNCQTKAGLLQKLKEIQIEFDTANSVNDFRSDLRARVRWLVQFYQSLP